MSYVNHCPDCGTEVTVWADNSDVDRSGHAITVNFRCPNACCKAGKGPWDTPEPDDDVSPGTGPSHRIRD